MMKITLGLLLSAFLITLSPAAGFAKIVDRIVAQVNDEIITLSDLEQAIKYSRGGAKTTPTEDDAITMMQLRLLLGGGGGQPIMQYLKRRQCMVDQGFLRYLAKGT